MSLGGQYYNHDFSEKVVEAHGLQKLSTHTSGPQREKEASIKGRDQNMTEKQENINIWCHMASDQLKKSSLK